jgi:hypothetical protein
MPGNFYSICIIPLSTAIASLIHFIDIFSLHSSVSTLYITKFPEIVLISCVDVSLSANVLTIKFVNNYFG